MTRSPSEYLPKPDAERCLHGLCLDDPPGSARKIADLGPFSFATSANLTTAVVKNGTPGKFDRHSGGDFCPVRTIGVHETWTGVAT